MAVFGNSVKSEIIEQWPTSVLSFSSEYPDEGWKAKNIVGPPKIYPKYGDTKGTWAPARTGTADWIILKCNKVVQIQSFQFWETNCCGSVVRIQAGQFTDPSNGATNTSEFQSNKPATTAATFAKDALNYTWVDLYTGVPVTLNPEARIWEPRLKTTDIWTDTIRIDVDGRNCKSYVEIDAIKIFGKANLAPAAFVLGSLSAQLLELYKTGEYADIIFVVERTEIPAHRGIIVARCDVFRNIFRSAKSNVIPIDAPLSAFKSFLEFVYTDSLNILSDQIFELYVLSKKYNVIKLKELVIHDFGVYLTIANIVNTTDHTFKLDAPELEQICRKFILNNLSAISQEPGYKLLPGSLLPAGYVGLV